MRSTPTGVLPSSAPRAALATALLITSAELVVLLVALSPHQHPEQHEATPAAVEHIVFVVPALRSARVAEQRVSSATRSNPVESSAATPATTPMMPRDSTQGGAPLPNVSAPSAGLPPSGAVVAGAGAAVGPVLAPRGFNPSAPLTRRVIDSVLDSLNANMPALIWARVPTQAERDATYKENALAMRLSGRTLLVPADPHLAPGIRISPFPSRRKQRDAARARTDSIVAENMVRLARLRARARRDSLHRDSLQRADSSRRADSLAAASPRRLPDARTPA